MKANKLIWILAVFSLVFAGCGSGDEQSFVRPYDDYGKFSLKRFKGEKLVNINVPAGDGFTWSPARKISGYLVFEFIFNTDMGEDWKTRTINFTVRTGRDLILSLDLNRDAFSEAENHYVFRKSIKTEVSLARDDQISFIVNDSHALSGDNFDLMRVMLVPRKGPDPSKNRNIVIITIDTLRADFLGYYRKLKGLYPDKISFSPNIDKIAESNLIFTRAYTPIASTWPALTSLALSRMPFEHGVQNNGDQLEDGESSIGQQLFRDRYSVSYRANAFQLDIGGFDEVKSFFRKDKVLKDSAKNFLLENHNKKFFLWLHFLGVHSGYRPSKEILARIEPEAYKGSVHKAVGPVLKKITAGEKQVTDYDIEHIRNCYAGELLQLDEWLEEIFTVMKEKKIWDNTLIIISADHGEDLYHHHKHFFHHPSIYNTSLHVPLVIKFPGSQYKGVIDQNVSILDFMPTLLDYFGIKTDYRMTGESLMPLIRGDIKGRTRFLYAESENNRILSVIGDQWKFIYNPEGIVPKTQYGNPYPIGNEEFYNISTDRLETDNLLLKQPPNIYKKLKFDLLNYIKLFQLDKKRKDRKKISEMPEEVQKELKTLGYI